jgi:hypothetical protein
MEQQTFQKPWQMTALQIHMVLSYLWHRVMDPIAGLFDTNTKPFQDELNRKGLKVVQ